MACRPDSVRLAEWVFRLCVCVCVLGPVCSYRHFQSIVSLFFVFLHTFSRRLRLILAETTSPHAPTLRKSSATRRI